MVLISWRVPRQGRWRERSPNSPFPFVLLVDSGFRTEATSSPGAQKADPVGSPFVPTAGTEPTLWYRNEGKHSLIFNLTSDHSAMGVTHSSRPCGGKPWGGRGQGGVGLPLILGRGPGNLSHHPTTWVKNFMINLG